MIAAEAGREFDEDRSFSWALFAVALLPRLFVAIAWSKEPVWDGHYYHLGAARIAAGLGYSEDVVRGSLLVWKPWAHYPVGYSALLSPFYFVFGPSPLIAPVISAFIGAITAVLVQRLARRFLSADRARVAGGLCALHPGLIAFCPLVMTEIPSAGLLTAFCYVLARFRGKRMLPLWAGPLLGALVLIRPASLLLTPLLLISEGRPGKRALVHTGLALALALAVVAPWTIRNCVRMDGCALVSTNGGWNLAIGALSDSGRFQTLRARDGCPVVTGQVQQDRCWAKVGLEKIRENPGRWLMLAPKKLAQTFDHESFAIEYLHEADPQAWPEPRRQAGRDLLSGGHLLVMAAAALSILAMPLGWRTPPEMIAQGALVMLLSAVLFYGIVEPSHPFHSLPLLVPLLACLPLPGRPSFGAAGRVALSALFITAVTHVVFFGEDRYHLVVSPLLCLLAAAALRGSNAELGRQARTT